jgi:hypothetical protein
MVMTGGAITRQLEIKYHATFIISTPIISIPFANGTWIVDGVLLVNDGT